LLSWFGLLRDRLALKNLHVYGDLLTLYHLPVHEPIFEVGRLYNDLYLLTSRLLTLYASYILARAGFYISMFASDDFADVEGEKLYTTKFSDEDWIKNFGLLPPGELDGISGKWDLDYVNQRGERIKVIFVEYPLRTPDSSVAQILTRYISEDGAISLLPILCLQE